MGFWDTLCFLCGVAPSGGPRHLSGNWRLEKNLSPVIDDLRRRDVKVSGKTPSDEELLCIVKEGFLSTRNINGGYLPRGYGENDYCQNYVGIGYWSDEDGTFWYSKRSEPRSLIPDGREVEIRRLRHADGYGGKFNTVLEKGEDGVTEEVSRDTYCDPDDSPCLFLCEHCYHFLFAWLETGNMPDRSDASPSDAEPLSFAGELYEMVNSRKEQRGCSGTLPEMEYDGIEDSLEQCQDFVFPGCWKDARTIAPAIEAGLRGEGLVPAIMRDSRAWMFMRPNIWPSPIEDNTPEFTKFTPGAIPALASLPLELLIPLLAQLPLVSILSLSATCRSLRNLITDQPFLDQVLKEAIMRGSLKWINPVRTIPKSENNVAREALLKWLASYREGKDQTGTEREGDEDEDVSLASNNQSIGSGGDVGGEDEEDEAPDEEDTGGEDPAALFVSQDFPRLAFVHACWESDSMMNRKRLWGQVKRFEALWRDYRMNGWQEQIFYPSAELGSSDGQSEDESE